MTLLMFFQLISGSKGLLYSLILAPRICGYPISVVAIVGTRINLIQPVYPKTTESSNSHTPAASFLFTLSKLPSIYLAYPSLIRYLVSQALYPKSCCNTHSMESLVLVAIQLLHLPL